MFFYVIIAQWLYAELQIVCPSAAPTVDYLVSSLQIPTHDKWSEEKVKTALNSASSMIRRISHDASSSLAGREDTVKPFLDALSGRSEGGHPQEIVKEIRIVQARRL